MEIRDMKMEDVESRLEEIRGLIETPDADLTALNAEVDQLTQRKADIIKAAEDRKALEAKVLENGRTIRTFENESVIKEEKQKMTDNEVRAKEFLENGKLEIRQLLSTGKIAVPTKVGGVNGLASVASDIVDDVHAFSLSGNGAWIAAYKKTEAGAAAVTDGTAVGGTASAYDYVTINPAEWGVLDEISKQVKKLTPLSYLDAIEEAAVIALREYASNMILTALGASTLVQAKTTVALDQNYLRNTVLGFRPIKGKGPAKLYINSTDLATIGAVRGTNEKKALYEISFDNEELTAGTIKEGGIAVKFRILDGLTTGTQYFGQPGCIDMPMWDGYSVETDEGGDYFKRNMIGIRGLQTAGADLVVKNGMQKITQ